MTSLLLIKHPNVTVIETICQQIAKVSITYEEINNFVLYTIRT